MEKHNGTVILQFDSATTGNVAVGIPITVRKKIGSAPYPVAVLYDEDNTSSLQKNNPFVSGSTGEYSFYAEDGTYIIEYSGKSYEVKLRDTSDHSTLSNRNIEDAHYASAISRGASDVDADLSTIEGKLETIASPAGASNVGAEGGSVQDILSALQTGQGAGVIGYATQTELFANLNFDDGSIAYVTNDPVVTNNGTYRKSGASGTGSWIQSSNDMASLAYQGVNIAKQLIEISEIQSLARNINMFDYQHPTNIPNKYLNADGTLSGGSLAYYTVSHYIPLREGEQLFLTAGSYPTGAGSVCYYDADLNFVRGVAAATSIIAQTSEEYVRISLRHDVTGSVTLTDVVCSTLSPQTGITYARKQQYDVAVPSTDIFPEGKMELSLPLLRNGGSIVDSSINVKQFGFDKAIQCRTNGNTYAYKQSNIGGKSYVAMMFSKHTGGADSPIENIAVFGSDAFNVGLASVSNGNVFNINCGNGVVLHCAPVKFAAGHQYFYIGTTKSFPTTTAEMFGMALFEARDNDSTGEKTAQAYLQDCMSRVQRREVLAKINELGSNNTTEFVIAGEYATITGSKFKRKTRAYRDGLYTADTSVFNYDTDYIGETQISPVPMTDDVAPIHALGTTVMANHSYFGDFLTVASHTKTAADVGSRYTNGGNTYVLVQVVGATSLTMMRDNSNSSGLPTSGTLTYVDGGVDTGNIVFTSRTFKQCYPCFGDYVQATFVDGVEIPQTNTTTSFKNNVTITESYDLLDRQTIVNWYINDYDGTRKPQGDSVLNYSGTFRFDMDGNCTQSGYYVATSEFLMSDIMGMQAIRSGVSYYIPKTVGFTYDGATVNFAKKASSTTCSGGSQTSIFFTPEKLDGSAIPSDRWIQINADGSYSAMGFTPLGDCGLNRAANVTAYTCEIRGNTDKIYPRVLDIGDFTTSVGQSWSFVGYRNVGKPQGIETCSYPVRTDGDDFYYVDYHNVQAIDTLEMPADFIGREFEIVESRNISVYGSLMAARMTFNVNCLGDYGYVVFRVKK